MKALKNLKKALRPPYLPIGGTLRSLVAFPTEDEATRFSRAFGQETGFCIEGVLWVKGSGWHIYYSITHEAAKSLNKQELSKAMGVSRSYVTKMIQAGFRLTGNQTYLLEARRWLQDHPEFKATNRKKQ